MYAAATLLTGFVAFVMLVGFWHLNGATTTVPWHVVLFSLLLVAFGFYLGRQTWLHALDARNGVATQIEGRITLRVSAGTPPGNQYLLPHSRSGILRACQSLLGPRRRVELSPLLHPPGESVESRTFGQTIAAQDVLYWRG